MDATATLIGIARLALERPTIGMLRIVDRRRMVPRAVTTERIAGLLTTLLGVGGAAVAAFAPLAANESCEAALNGGTNCRTWSSSLWQDERGAALTIVIAVATLSLAVAGAAIVDTNGGPRRRAALSCAAALLTGSAVLGLASVGLFILPAAFAAIIASLAAFLRSESATSPSS